MTYARARLPIGAWWWELPFEKMTKLFFEMNAYDIDTRIAVFVMRRTTPEPLPGVEFIHFVERLYDSTMKTPHVTSKRVRRPRNTTDWDVVAILSGACSWPTTTAGKLAVGRSQA